MKNMSSTLPHRSPEDPTLSCKESKFPRNNEGIVRIPNESMKSDRRIRIYLGQIAERYDVVLKKSNQGFGLTLVDDLVLNNKKLLKVRSVYKNGPAAKTGVIQPGDVLSAFNHIDIIGVQPEDVIKMFKVIKEKEFITLTIWKLSESRPTYPFDPTFDIIHFYLQKSDTGFGFILGNCNEEHQVAKVNGEGDVKLLLQTNDRLLAIGQVSIGNLLHDQVVKLLMKFPKNHFLQFTVKRDVPLLTRSISNDICPAMNYSMNSSIYSKISRTNDPNVYTSHSLIGASGPFNTPDFIPAAHYLSLNRQRIQNLCDISNCDANCLPNLSNSTPTTPMISEYRTAPDCIPEPYKSSPLSMSPSSSIVFVQIVRSQSKGFGFRLMGGSDEGCQVFIGAIVPEGPIDKCGVVDCGDILTEVNGQSTSDKTHAEIVAILEETARSPSGKLDLYIKKRGPTSTSGRGTPKTDPCVRVVTLTRSPDEGFGFVIVSAVRQNEPCGIGRINPGSVADRNSDLHLGDRILEVNGQSLRGLHYKDVMKIVKECDLQIVLTVCNGNINGLKTIKYEFASQAEFENPQQLGKSETPSNINLQPSSQPVSIMKSTSQFDNPYRCNPRPGDKILEIKHNSTEGMTHAAAVEEIQSGADTVHLLLQRH